MSTIRDEIANIQREAIVINSGGMDWEVEASDAIIALLWERLTSDEAVNAAMKWIYNEPWELARDSQKHVVRSTITAALDAVLGEQP